MTEDLQSGIRRVAVVTGGSQGLGLAIGQRLCADGFDVVSVDVVPGATQSDGQNGIAHRELDVRDHAAVDSVFDSIASDYGRLDVLINNAGIQRHGPLVDIPAAEWQRVVDVNLNGVFNCLRAAGRHMLAAGNGAVLNVTSVAGTRGAPGRAPYSATKAAVIGLTRAAAVEWAQGGVRVNAIGPGYVDSGVFRAGVAAGSLDPSAILARIPMGRLAAPEEVAALASFLVSEQASYVTGQAFFVDGGFLADYGIPLVTAAPAERS